MALWRGCAMTDRSGSHLRTRKIDPELPFRNGLVNERKAQKADLGLGFARSGGSLPPSELPTDRSDPRSLRSRSTDRAAGYSTPLDDYPAKPCGRGHGCRRVASRSRPRTRTGSPALRASTRCAQPGEARSCSCSLSPRLASDHALICIAARWICWTCMPQFSLRGPRGCRRRPAPGRGRS